MNGIEKLSEIVELEAQKLLKLAKEEMPLSLQDVERLEVLSRCAKQLRAPMPKPTDPDDTGDLSEEEMVEIAKGPPRGPR